MGTLPFKVGDIVIINNHHVVIRSIYRNSDGTLGGSFSFIDEDEDFPRMAFDEDFKNMKKTS